jgi:hypothetical protein
MNAAPKENEWAGWQPFHLTRYAKLCQIVSSVGAESSDIGSASAADRASIAPGGGTARVLGFTGAAVSFALSKHTD